MDMTTNAKVIKKANTRNIYKGLCAGFAMWALILLFLGFNYISEGYHSAATDVIVLGLGATATSLSAVFYRRATSS